MGPLSDRIRPDMNDKLAILVCSHLLQDAGRALRPSVAKEVELFGFPTACDCMRQPDDAALTLARELHEQGFEVHVLGGSCFGMGNPVEQLQPGVTLHRANPCAKLFVSSDVADRLIDEGAYLVTHGWVRDWERKLACMGFDQPTAREFFRESTTSVVLIDTLDDHGSRSALREFAAYVGMPPVVIPAGLDLLASRLDNVVETWRWQRERGALEAAQAASNRRMADYALVQDVLGKLVSIQSERELVAAIFELFSMLFAPAGITFLPFRHGAPGEAVLWPDNSAAQPCDSAEAFDLQGEECAWSRSGNGFALRLRHMNETLAMVELRQVACPQYRDHYLELGVTLARLCGLAIANARNFQAAQDLAGTDELTGVANRRRFFALAERQLMLARRHGYRLCVLMFDIDHFKQVNDTHGHATGDLVLRQVAQTCSQAIRVTDVLGRYGGEEFVALLHETDLAGAGIAAERMRASVEALCFETPKGTLRVTISVGVAECAPERELAAEVARADEALYRAKGAGRNRVTTSEPMVASPPMRAVCPAQSKARKMP